MSPAMRWSGRCYNPGGARPGLTPPAGNSPVGHWTLGINVGQAPCLLRALAAPQDYPEHRLQFFGLLRAITANCFRTLFALSPAQLKLVIDSIVWAFRHTERNIADTGAWWWGQYCPF